MQSRIMFFIAAVFGLFSACSKTDVESDQTPVSADDCVQTSGPRSGDSTGVYIVSYRSGIMGRSESPENMEEKSENILSRHQISKQSLQTYFPGEPGGFIAKMSAREAAELRTDTEVAIVEEDRIISLNTCFTVVEPRLLTWNITQTGYGDGRGKTVWVIDTGIDFDHPDLTVDKSRSKSFISANNSADDENGHGTHVAGVIGAKNNSIGTLGIASGATLVSLRVLDKDGEGFVSSIVQALGYVSANAAAGDVVNMSVGSDDGVSATLDNQVRQTASRGIYIAIAAGNENKLANLSSPARVNAPNVYTISAIDSTGRFASFSNFGNDVVDYAMPGVRILSSYMGGRYAYMSGTSMAAPHMAGILALRGRGFSVSGNASNDPDGDADPIAHY